jgi:hypothetical protein
MSDLRTAAQQALEALENIEGANATDRETAKEAIAALRAALEAKQEVEPVAWLKADGEDAMTDEDKNSWLASQHPSMAEGFTVPLYTAPPARKPLSDQEIQDMLPTTSIRCPLDALWFARAIERAHGITGGGDE